VGAVERLGKAPDGAEALGRERGEETRDVFSRPRGAEKRSDPRLVIPDVLGHLGDLGKNGRCRDTPEMRQGVADHASRVGDHAGIAGPAGELGKRPVLEGKEAGGLASLRAAALVPAGEASTRPLVTTSNERSKSRRQRRSELIWSSSWR
jgi:hypothetical protein